MDLDIDYYNNNEINFSMDKFLKGFVCEEPNDLNSYISGGQSKSNPYDVANRMKKSKQKAENGKL